MQCEYLYGVTSLGNVHQFNIKTHQWKQFGLNQPDLALKRISISPLSSWAVGGDHRIYIFVPKTDIPIRVCAVTYENQRYLPIWFKFTSTLLPTDRSPWSNEDGTKEAPKISFKLPSRAWQWESDWYVDDNIGGEPLGPEGWTYAIDFPMKYNVNKEWNSLVRRRKWIKYRRFVSVNQWSPIESTECDEIEPFIDISVGGYNVPGGQKEHLSVWAVTILGQIVFRENVERLSPEGTNWKNIDVPQGFEVSQISCGPTGLVWAVSWDGSALVRTGITRENLTGNSWICIEPPNDTKLNQVSVGIDAVWALTRDYRVFFRKGVRGLDSGSNESSATGSGWVEMLQQMALLTVTANDQVWALCTNRKTIYFRTGISYGELHGKSWKLVTNFGKIVNNNHINQMNKTFEDESSLSSYDSTNCIEGDCNWSWISASCCNVNADLYLQFSCDGSSMSLDSSFDNYSEDLFKQIKTMDWKIKIFELLQERYEREMKDFISQRNEENNLKFAQAIECGTWVKSATCFVMTSKNKTWHSGKLDLERQGVEGNIESGRIDIIHLSSSKVRKISINLSEIRCVLYEHCEKTPSKNSVCLVIITKLDKIRLCFNEDGELEDWLATINLACGDIHGINGSTAVLYATIFTISNNGDVYLGHKVNGKDLNSLFFYHFGGGHFNKLSACCCGSVIWSLNEEGNLFVYTNGYGGGIYKGFSGVNKNCYPISDTKSLYCYENQRWNPLLGFAAIGLPTDRYMWSDETGRIELSKDSIKLPSRHWQWITDWHIDYTTPDGVDKEGWQYSFDFPETFPWFPEKKFLSNNVRRRRWFRKCKITTSGPWMEFGQTTFRSISLFCNETNSKETCICVWAVSSDGEALCRIGVTSCSPQGHSWQHIACEQPLVNISVGGSQQSDCYEVWAIAEDGSAFLRHNVSQNMMPSGSVWFHVEPPKKNCPLVRISVGKTSVWAVDEKNRLWFRAEIVPTFPEGTHWKKICDNVLTVSSNCQDELFAILIKESSDNARNILAKRVGINETNKIGTDWEYVSDQLTYFQFVSSSIGCVQT